MQRKCFTTVPTTAIFLIESPFAGDCSRPNVGPATFMGGHNLSCEPEDGRLVQYVILKI